MIILKFKFGARFINSSRVIITLEFLIFDRGSKLLLALSSSVILFAKCCLWWRICLLLGVRYSGSVVNLSLCSLSICFCLCSYNVFRLQAFTRKFDMCSCWVILSGNCKVQTSNFGNKRTSLYKDEVEFLPSRLEIWLYSFVCIAASIIIVGIGLGVAVKKKYIIRFQIS